MITINETITIDESELEETFVRSPGPGGQNVNKVATTAQLRFDVANSPSLPEDVRRRLLKLAGSRITGKGVLVITARRYRSRERNRQDARSRLKNLILRAIHKPKPRRKTKPTQADREERLREKHHRSQIKRTRRRVKDTDY
jgi:ribosome-associated protein